MIHQFDPHPDELLYSVLARYHIISRNINIGTKETVNDAFSSKTASAVVDFPSRLSMFHLNLPKGTKYTPERIIRDLTLLPLYAPFMPIERLDKAIHKMKENGDVHTTIGVMASAIPVSRYMRYCSSCYKEDEMNFGQSYWHRSHQVPGVNACDKHQIRLLDSKLQITQKENKHEFVDISNASCYGSKEVDYDLTEHERFISKSVEWLLHHEVPIMGFEAIQNNYRVCLQMQGYANFNGKVRIDKFLRSFVGFYGHEFLDSLHCSIDPADSTNWLLKLVRKQRAVTHPIRHLLLMRFLGQTPEMFFAEKKEYKPFGTGPWPCLNAATDHFHQDVIEEVQMNRDFKTGHPVGNFSCACGFSYVRRGPDRTELNRYKVGNVIKYGHTWESKLRSLANQEGMTIAKMSSILGCDRITTKKYKTILMQEEESVTKEPDSHTGIDEEKAVRRDNWLEIQKRLPSATRKEIRKIAPANFIWLYRHDREWLYLHSPVITPKQKYSDTRVNWLERDREILVAAKDVVELEFSGRKKPERLCVSMIGKRTGRLSILQKHPHKVPETMSYITTVVESIDDFQVRRVKYAAQQLRNDSELLMEWKIVRKAGLRPGFSMKVYQQVLRECARQ
ncbi:TnsD family transposase [Paenibacillus sp. LHD-38]|uniref:TnsD family transposase n=1 Tax=Paenibacillus sp. LHD-38 TaxID=3072143 RepID=UPI00280D9349|nr:TnsD family transposase [Paenibacillus sp. LHD-38]MDQ8734248.1 TnsD family transposase [Paenibacillus sp. LHD-38]